MKGLLVVLLLLVVSGVAGLVVTRILAGKNIGTGAPRWWLAEYADGGRFHVELLPPGHLPQDPVAIAELDPEAEDFEYELEEARARAIQKLVALNRPYDEPQD